MKTKNISIMLREVRCCNTAPSDLISSALSEPPTSPISTSDGNVEVPSNFCRICHEKEFAPVGGVLTDTGGLRLRVKTPSSYQHLEWAEVAEKQQYIVGSLSRCINTGDGKALCFLSCLSVRTASRMREGAFSVILNTLILKVITKTRGFHRYRANQWKT